MSTYNDPWWNTSAPRRILRGVFIDRWGHLRFAWIVTIVLGVVALIVGGIVFAGVNYSRGVDARACRAFGERTGRTVKFATYNWGSWGCLVRASDGRYLPKSQIVSYVKGGGPK